MAGWPGHGTRLLIVLALCLPACDQEQARRPPAPAAPDSGTAAPAGPASAAPSDIDAPPDEVTGARIDESAVAHTIHVDPARGDDEAAGSRGSPLETLGAAAAIAEPYLEAGRGVHIHLAAGTYRESVVFWPDEPTPVNAPLVIEGAAPGKVVLTGSDDWSAPERWRPVQGMPGVIAIPWPHDWGDAAVAVSGEPEGDHPPAGVRGFAPDDGTAIIEWKAPVALADPAGYRVLRREDGRWQEVARLGPETHRLVDETVRPPCPAETRTCRYKITALDPAGEPCGTSRVVRIDAGGPDGTSRPAAVGRRREMVFVDGRLMRQVLSADDLRPGTFCVDAGWPGDPDDGRLYLALPRGARRGEATIEVSVRPTRDGGPCPLVLGRQTALVLRNLTVEHYAVPPGRQAAATVEHGGQVLIEDCTFRWNNAAGLRLGPCEGVTLRRCAAEHNGRAGIRWGGCATLLAEDITVAHNNWRGDWGGSLGGQVAGLAFGFTDHACRLRRVTATQNACPGVWVSTFGAVPSPTSARVFIEGLVSTENAREGLIVSESPGPVRIRGAVLARNGRSGLLLAATSGGTLAESTLYTNAGAQIDVLPSDPFAQDHHPTLGTTTGRGVRDWTWRANAIVSAEAGASLVRVPPAPHLLGTLRSDRNLWYGPDEAHAFVLGEMGFPLEVWQQVTGQDLGSMFAPPRFRAPANLDFRPDGDSPLTRRERWPRRGTMAPNLARLAEFRAARARAVNGPPYPSAAETGAARWHALDLRPAAAQPLTGSDAWLGRPFRGLVPGRHTFHGVPFEVAPAPDGGPAAVALRSARVRAFPHGPEVPARVTVPVGRRVRAVYVLHGCGYASRFGPMARYELLYEDGSASGIDAVALGPAPETPLHLDRLRRRANLQDRLPGFHHFTGDRARCALILDPDDPAGGARYLYTLRWRNPHPGRPVAAIRLAPTDPQAEVSVVVVAVTVCLNE